MLLSDLLRCEVRSESGEKLGHVFDVRVARRSGSSPARVDQTWRLTGLLVGSRGARERFGLTPGRPGGYRHMRDAIPWGDVIGVDDGVIVVRDAAKPR
jgi:sporulation protein YlmC with PRC-barrel domain